MLIRLDKLADLLRWRVWGVPKLSVLFFCYFYISLRQSFLGAESVIDFFLLAALLSSYMSFGHIVNDYSDREIDQRAGKTRNILIRLSNRDARIIVLASLALTILSAIPLLTRPLFSYIFVLSLFVAAFYSLKPLRLKERGLMGLISVAISVEVLPLMLVFSALRYFGIVDILLFTAYYASWGLKEIARHQIADFEGDLKASVRTFAISKGLSTTMSIYSLSYLTERIALTMILLWITVQLPLTLLATLVYLSAGAYKFVRKGFRFIPPEVEREGRSIVHLFPRMVLPFYVLGLLVLYSSYFLAPLFFLFLWEAKLLWWLIPSPLKRDKLRQIVR